MHHGESRKWRSSGIIGYHRLLDWGALFPELCPGFVSFGSALMLTPTQGTVADKSASYSIKFHKLAALTKEWGLDADCMGPGSTPTCLL